MSHYICKSCRSSLLRSSKFGQSRPADSTTRAYRVTPALKYQTRPALRKNVADALDKDNGISLATDSNVPVLNSLGVPPAPTSAVVPSTLQPPETSKDRQPNIRKYISRDRDDLHKPRTLPLRKVATRDLDPEKGFHRVWLLPEEPQDNTQKPGVGSNAKPRLPKDDPAKAIEEKKITPRGKVNVFKLLATPTWSIRSLLPDPDSPVPPSEIITREKLHHLLRLSALPYPETTAEEEAMIETLHSQLHFVKDIQKVNTEGVEPLISLRDETEEGVQDITITMDTLKEAFAGEEIVGARLRRPRRMREEGNPERVIGVEDWDPLSTAGQVVERGGGRYFVVKGLEKKVDQPA